MRGTSCSSPSPVLPSGLSPRVRGNQLQGEGTQRWHGSIPARAGEPPCRHLQIQRLKVYPRACGGTRAWVETRNRQSGLSPRVRGNPSWAFALPEPTGSIPARAGEPASASGHLCSPRVYPRACGGTLSSPSLPRPRRGLSPRVRGNLDVLLTSQPGRRSIPARAGEPTRRPTSAPLPWVYPRACGGTRSGKTYAALFGGLSPRVRGNRNNLAQAHGTVGSIPARAGEPSQVLCHRGLEGVYPRACGGTVSIQDDMPSGTGLSPRVRGNPAPEVSSDIWRGSIPARAGEPRCWPRPPGPCPVYPRACGGTLDLFTDGLWDAGLSPRVRGNHTEQHWPQSRDGSIPARAGEPRCVQPAGLSTPVYPRACGEPESALFR